MRKAAGGPYPWIGVLIVLLGLALLKSSVLDRPFLEHVGTALFVLGGIEILLHVPKMNDHFLALLRESIVKDEYLDKLDPGALKDLVRRAFQVRMNIPSSKENIGASFLTFFFDRLERYISEPHREDAHCTVGVHELPGDDRLVKIVMTVTYICREGRDGAIQPNVSWEASSLEAVLEPENPKDIPHVEIALRKHRRGSEEGTNEWGSVKFIHEVMSEFCFQAPERALDWRKNQAKRDSEELVGFRLVQPISRFDPSDGLEVRMQVVYLALKDSLQNWRMAYPTNGFTLTFDYPQDCDIHIVYLLSGAEAHEERDPLGGSCTISCRDSWALQGSGIAWRLVPRSFRKDAGDAIG